MPFKWIGSALIIGSSIVFAAKQTVYHATEIHLLDDFIRIIDNITSELTYHLTSLPELIATNANHSPTIIRKVFTLLAENLNQQILPDAESCMISAIQKTDIPYVHLQKILLLFGNSIGRFDLDGQIKELEITKEQCKQELQLLKSNHTERIRSTRVLCLCAAIALVILLI